VVGFSEIINKLTQSLEGKKNRFFNLYGKTAHITALSKAREWIRHSYIVFSERCELNKITIEAPGVVVLKRNRLLAKLRQDMGTREKVFMKTEMDELERELKSFALADETTKNAHVESVMAK
jgi:hypothetical protein